MKVVSNGQLWMYTIALLLFWIIVLTTALNEVQKMKQKISLPQTNTEDDLKYTKICKNLCKLCTCLDFYCGEECICECNDDRTDTGCIRKMQRSGQSLNIPFEVLIQGPTANKFVRNALLYEQDQERKLYGYRNKRSTVTVYKPSKANLSMQKDCCENKTALKDIFKATGSSKKRRKRSSGTNHFEWFSNLGSNLLRPAPLGGCKRQVEESTKATVRTTTVSPYFGNSWIFDSFDDTRNILTPRPLKKRKNQQSSSENNQVSSLNVAAESSHASNENKDSRKLDFSYSEILKDTQPNKKESPSSDDTEPNKSPDNLINRLYSRLLENTLDALDDDEKYQNEPLEPRDDYSLYNDLLSEIDNDKMNLFVEEQQAEKMQESKASDLSKSQNDLSASPVNKKKDLNEFRISWFKPKRLLQKFRQAIYN